MSDTLTALKLFLESRKADYVTSIRVIAETKSAILDVPRDRIGEAASGRITSRRQLDRLASDIKKEFGLSVLFAFRSEGLLADIEAGLRATLERRFPAMLSEFVVSFPSVERAEVLFRRSGQTDVVNGAEIQAAVTEFLREASFRDVHVEELNSELPPPSLMNILRALKSCAPATVDQLLLQLLERGFSCTDARWLSNKLDTAR